MFSITVRIFVLSKFILPITFYSSSFPFTIGTANCHLLSPSPRIWLLITVCTLFRKDSSWVFTDYCWYNGCVVPSFTIEIPSVSNMKRILIPTQFSMWRIHGIHCRSKKHISLFCVHCCSLNAIFCRWVSCFKDALSFSCIFSRVKFTMSISLSKHSSTRRSWKQDLMVRNLWKMDQLLLQFDHVKLASICSPFLAHLLKHQALFSAHCTQPLAVPCIH